ncbi:WecB/TagA/CpsF family glycosyltransferase [Marivirga sp.]|uniref:WecB/TagA/CpsF family glycosyltransferase n=1 Tax=Marivirga sp. TaxID=2018662 RepID=UPI002D807160|nr:WecB/TagA/CpsF family glycosyltransferase [Marivirga sp.]HET8858747.1 WecB/TagA/CpsF family glycosyltransferase [Marivirga sp.]
MNNILCAIRNNGEKNIGFYDKEANVVTFLNPVSYVIVRNSNIDFEKFDCIYIDGLLLVKLLKLFNVVDVNRISFDMTSLAPKLFDHVRNENKSIYFLGSKKEEISNFVKLIQSEFNLNIKGFRDGYFDVDNCEDIITEIQNSAPDYLVVGMGSPRQEEFLIKFREKNLKNITCFTCGGFFHQTQSKIDYYPKWIDKFNLRMPYRLIKERLYSRLKYYPLFLFYFLKDYIRFKTAK